MVVHALLLSVSLVAITVQTGLCAAKAQGTSK